MSMKLTQNAWKEGNEKHAWEDMSSRKLLSCKLYMSPFILIIAVITPSYRRPKIQHSENPNRIVKLAYRTHL